MRHIRSNLICALGVICALCILDACGQKSTKKKASKKTIVENALQTDLEVPESSFGMVAHSDPLPSCSQTYGPFPSNGNSILGQAKWRIEAEQIKGQIFLEVQQEGLTQDAAVHIALVNNPGLLAYYENLEIGYADLLEAGLRENPVFEKSVRFPKDKNEEINREIGTTVNFLDYFLIPFRKNAALAELQVIESEFGQMVLDLAKEVKINWLTAKALEMELTQENQRIELKRLAVDLADLQMKAGNINSLTARNYKIEAELATSNLKTITADLEAAKEKLNRSLGLFGPESCYNLAGDIDWKKSFELPNLPDMEQAAIENRLDVEAVRREINALAEKAKLKDPWTYANLIVGQSKEKETDGSIVAGPRIELEIPIFNSGQAERKKYHALIEQAQKKLLSKAVQACSEVREFIKTTDIYRSQLLDLEEKILPDYKRQIYEAQAQYNVMTLGVYDLFELKESEIEATIDHIHAQKRYLSAKIELLHALGGNLVMGGKE